MSQQESIYKTMSVSGGIGIAAGITVAVVGVAAGVVMIVSGARLLLKKRDVII